MSRSLGLVPFLVAMLMVGQALGDSRPGVRLEDGADVILILVPDERIPLDRAAPFERLVQGTIVRVDKGPTPQTIVRTAHTFSAPCPAGVPSRLFLKKFKDRDVYYIIGVDPGGY